MVGGTSNNVRGVRKFFCAIIVPQSPIGLISAEIGALCRILGQASKTVYVTTFIGLFNLAVAEAQNLHQLQSGDFLDP